MVGHVSAYREPGARDAYEDLMSLADSKERERVKFMRIRFACLIACVYGCGACFGAIDGRMLGALVVTTAMVLLGGVFFFACLLIEDR